MTRFRWRRRLFSSILCFRVWRVCFWRRTTNTVCANCWVDLCAPALLSSELVASLCDYLSSTVHTHLMSSHLIFTVHLHGHSISIPSPFQLHLTHCIASCSGSLHVRYQLSARRHNTTQHDTAHRSRSRSSSSHCDLTRWPLCRVVVAALLIKTCLFSSLLANRQALGSDAAGREELSSARCALPLPLPSRPLAHILMPHMRCQSVSQWVNWVHSLTGSRGRSRSRSRCRSFSWA